ncbi:hypothetical protein M408DRAFT_236515 [Serendipita vermifera MAFF 305830]|uniref:Uncharacterized protein n=1 Tax=Serendipita vermifera MAFF 305830 TaxID=933852 RepID=A0A0C2X055_SERVB|nr:hypothetical protein M408DRAFT_236515 [Serendipita vermifera MAFF 305830]
MDSSFRHRPAEPATTKASGGCFLGICLRYTEPLLITNLSSRSMWPLYFMAFNPRRIVSGHS